MKDYNFCPYCGKNLPSGADYCPKCGSHIVRPEHVPAEQLAAPATQSETGGVISGTATDAQGHPS
jgi:predicted amidophosphoribosyltransferase